MLPRFWMVAAAGCVLASAQTRIDLNSQVRNIDFSTAPFTRPVKTGNALPPLCGTGDLFFLLNASPGRNLYGCAATNVWTVMSGGSASTQALPLDVSRKSDTELEIGASCTHDEPCLVRFGTSVFAVERPATVTFVNGSGVAYGFIAETGAVSVAYAGQAACTACVNFSGSGFPSNSVPIFMWAVESGLLAETGQDMRSSLISAGPVDPGLGLSRTVISGRTMMQIDPAVVGVRVPPPGSSSTACMTGSWAADDSYVYYCVSSNRWRRTGVAGW